MTATLQVRIDSDLRQAADNVFADIGIDTNSAIRLFLRQAVIRRTFPFEVVGSDPFYHPANQAFIARGIADYENGAQHYHAHELIDADAPVEKQPRSRTSTRRHGREKALV